MTSTLAGVSSRSSFSESCPSPSRSSAASTAGAYPDESRNARNTVANGT